MKFANSFTMVSIAVVVLAGGAVGFIYGESEKPPNQDLQNVNSMLDFSDYRNGPVEEWLKAKGFVLEKDAENADSIRLDASGNALTIEAKKRARGFLFNECVDLEKYSKVRIEWGVLDYPAGASYEAGVNNEALMVYIFFGYDKISSGHLLVPNSPYFIGLYLGKDEVGKAYEGKYYQKGGRFVCLGKPRPGETVFSEFDLIGAFRTYFQKDKIPLISGVSLGVDTSSSGNEGKARAFIRKIEFLQ